MIRSNWDITEFCYNKFAAFINANPIRWLKSGRRSAGPYGEVKALRSQQQKT